jgi:hypothetical protein
MPTWCETFICVDEDEIFDIDEADDGKLEMQADVMTLKFKADVKDNSLRVMVWCWVL